MSELSLEDFTRLVVRKIETLNENVTLSNPDTNENYPLGVVTVPMESILSTNESNIPVRKKFQISVEWWTDKQYTSMAKHNNCVVKLRELNMQPVGSNSSRYDETTKKHIYGCSYEVYYNGITNSLEKTK